jgi:ribose-phosphate pyrophosphokinase
MGFFDIPVDHLSAETVFVEYLQKTRPKNETVIVSPDTGGVVRARKVAQMLNANLAIIDKRRPGHNKAEVMNVIGEVQGLDMVIIDDMIDTAGTLVQAVGALEREGARRIIAGGVHAVLSGPAIERLKSAPIEEIVVTNSIPLTPDKLLPTMTVLTVAPLLGEAIRRIHDEESVSTLFA